MTSRISPNAQVLSANNKQPIQHLPFFSSTDLQIDPATDEQQTSARPSNKLEAARQSRLQKKMLQSSMQFSSSFKDAATMQQAFSSHDSHRVSQKNFLSTTSSKEDQKLGDLHKMQERISHEMVETGESSGEARQLLKTVKEYKANEGGRASVHSQGVKQRRTQDEEEFML